MQKKTWLKWGLLVLLTAFSLSLLVPRDSGFGRFMDRFGIRTGLRLGLDLRGGMSFTVIIDEPRVPDLARRLLSSEKGREPTEDEVKVKVADIMKDAPQRALEMIRNRIDALGINEPEIKLDKNNGRILVQLPGVDDAKRTNSVSSIQNVAYLEFRLVHKDNDQLVAGLFEKNLAPEGYLPAEAAIDGRRDSVFRKDDSFKGERDLDRLGMLGVPDANYEFMLEERKEDGKTDTMVYRPMFVKRVPEMGGEFIKDARKGFGDLGQKRVVLLEFDSQGAVLFANITRKNVGRSLGIVLDGKLYSAPVIQEAIKQGSAQISGNFTDEEAEFLSMILRTGSLPAPVKIIEMREVDATLGTDSIQSGTRATLLGCIGVVVFMSLYYLIPGLVANFALMLNLLLLPVGAVVAAAVMGMLFAGDVGAGRVIALPVLTLPGIAGIVLTLGMAVDANILIFERMREESRAGKTLWAAITAGYDRAWIAILDSNLTTVLTAVILFALGAGPVRGYAVTLTAGIIISLYTAIVVTGMLFKLLVDIGWLKQLRMASLVRETNVDFIKWRVPAAAASVVVIVVSWVVLSSRVVRDPGSVLAVDFLGGAASQFSYAAEAPPTDAVRDALAGSGIADAVIQYRRLVSTEVVDPSRREAVGGSAYLQVTTAHSRIGERGVGDAMLASLQSKFPEAGFKLLRTDEVGSQVGADLQRKAVWAVALSLVGIVLYLAVRFELGFALGAVVAVLHDALVAVGVYVLLGRQLNTAMIAAVLTIIGWSVNDTIVIFDRIRENLRKDRTRSFRDLCNWSINQTLGRTLLTSVTVLITVLILLLFGGGAINDFALIMLIGVIAGSYSTIYVATPVVLLWHRNRRPELGRK